MGVARSVARREDAAPRLTPLSHQTTKHAPTYICRFGPSRQQQRLRQGARQGEARRAKPKRRLSRECADGGVVGCGKRACKLGREKMTTTTTLSFPCRGIRAENQGRTLLRPKKEHRDMENKMASSPPPPPPRRQRGHWLKRARVVAEEGDRRTGGRTRGTESHRHLFTDTLFTTVPIRGPEQAAGKVWGAVSGLVNSRRRV